MFNPISSFLRSVWEIAGQFPEELGGIKEEQQDEEQKQPLVPNTPGTSSIHPDIERSDFPKAINKLLAALSNIQPSDIEVLFKSLIVLIPKIPKCDEANFKTLMQRLPNLLAVSSHLFHEQGLLALELASYHLAHTSYLEAMYYYGKAIQIAEAKKDQELSQKSHLLATQLLLQISKSVGFEDFKARLRNVRGKPQLFNETITSLATLKQFCCTKEDQAWINQLYDQAMEVYNEINLIPEDPRIASLPLLQEGVLPFFLPDKTRTEVYKEKLNSFRKCFGSKSHQDLRDFQRYILGEMREFFQLLLKDIFSILGPPPCDYDFRAMGSLGREEPCLYSDLEFMILIKNPDAKKYFQDLISLLQFQLQALGETPENLPPFTCIHKTNPSGFHIDTGCLPPEKTGLIGTPESVAQLQMIDPSNADPTTLANSLLKTTSLSCNCPNLFESYSAKVIEILNVPERRQTRFLNLIQKRYAEYHGTKKSDGTTDISPLWPTSQLPHSVDVKNHYVQFLNFFLADLALYFGVESTNTLDIIDTLVKKNVFTQLTGNLLKEAVSTIYRLRLRLHQFYGEQKEEGYLEGRSGCILMESEKAQLEKIYWLILRPLYQSCLPLVLEKGEPVEQVFRKLDLLSVGLDEVYTFQEDPNYFKPFIHHVVTHLIKEPFDTHLKIYKKLSIISSLDSLRQVYLEALEKNQAPDALLEQIRAIPNRTGLRLASLKKESQLVAQLQAISTPEISDLPFDPKVEWIPKSTSQVLSRDELLKTRNCP